MEPKQQKQELLILAKNGNSRFGEGEIKMKKIYTKPEMTIDLTDDIVVTSDPMNNTNQPDNWENGQDRDDFFGGN